MGAPHPRGDLLPRTTVEVPEGARWTWCGVSGGVGASSLAAHSPAAAVSGAWPDPTLGWPAPTVLVARSSMSSLNAAGRFLQEWASGHVRDLHMVGLVISADAPARPPRAVRARLSELSSLVAVWRLPWIATWRETPEAADPAATRIVATVAARLQEET